MIRARPGFLALILLVIMLVLLAWRCRHAGPRVLQQLPKRIRRLALRVDRIDLNAYGR